MRVLVVEDDARIASDVSRALEGSGYVVEVVINGEDAWFKGDTEDYGAVILDLGLPGMDGLAVLKRWRANERHVPVLILTARGRGRWHRCRRRRLPAQAVPDRGAARASPFNRAALVGAPIFGDQCGRDRAGRAADEGDPPRHTRLAVSAGIPFGRPPAAQPRTSGVAARVGRERLWARRRPRSEHARGARRPRAQEAGGGRD